MTPRTALLLLLLLLLGDRARAQERQYTARVVTTVSSSSAPAWRTWRGHQFSVNYPGDWTVTQGGQVTFQSPTEGPGDYQESVTMLVFERPVTDTAAWAANNLREVKEEFPSATVRSDDRSADEQVLQLSLTEDGKALHYRRIFKREGAYTVIQTYRALDTSFEEKVHLADAVISSVHILQP